VIQQVGCPPWRTLVKVKPLVKVVVPLKPWLPLVQVQLQVPWLQRTILKQKT
jgi:hypothetical protein